ncbi:MAG: amidohydrolase [Candidatus Palauibacterales bacterium]|nr:amidohydrolase [Candidatus Palauibacterales bacterium]
MIGGAERLGSLFVASALAALWLAGCGGPSAPTADLLITGGEVWTGDPDRPRAGAVAVEGHEILAVGSASELEPHVGPETRVIDADGAFVAPGFIDSHTHFDRAGRLLLGINLLDVSTDSALVQRVRAARERLPEGAWITGGDWGAYAEWEQGSAGEESSGGGGGADADGGGRDFRPTRALLDSITPETPIFLSRWDGGVYLANGAALEAAEVDCTTAGVECEDGSPTGRLSPAAAEAVRGVVPERSMERRIAEADTAFDRLVAAGVTTIHDVTPASQMRVFEELQRRDSLEVRVYARPILDDWDELRAAGIQQGFGDRWLRLGTLKGFVDGIMGNSSARFYEPYDHTGERGSWREMVRQPPGIQRLMTGADSSGLWMGIHAIGDQAIDTLLTMYSRVLEENGPKSADGAAGLEERRNRIIHTQVLRGPEVADRIAELGLIAEVQPIHVSDDMRWMEERIGEERSRWAYAFGTLEEAGVRLSFGSDWPGTNAAWYPTSPVKGIYAAVTRKTLSGEPEGGWFPEERVSVETALRAYTVNNAWAEGREHSKGSIEPGKLADLVVLDRSPLQVPADSLKDLEVLYTIVDGRVVHEGP